MKRKTLLLLISALLVPFTARAQSATQQTPQSAQQPAKGYSTLDDDPAFKRLSPEKQELVRKAMQNIDNAIADDRKNAANPDAAKPRLSVPPAQSGCDASPIKKPRFHIPKAVQDAIKKQAKQVSSRTGVDVDPNAPEKAVKDAQQKLPPCPPAAPAKQAKK